MGGGRGRDRREGMPSGMSNGCIHCLHGGDGGEGDRCILILQLTKFKSVLFITCQLHFDNDDKI